MIDNSDMIGHYHVTVIAKKNQVNSFQCPTMSDAFIEVRNLAMDRQARGLTTDKAYARLIYDKSEAGLHLGPKLDVVIPKDCRGGK